MECTQKIECTQELYPTVSQRLGPDQVGFLGIHGQTYPVNLGPNKIGRDPSMCDIVLDMTTLSRQHAVINVLSKQDYMLMDLGSANYTKLGLKKLLPYVPHPLQNGDTVQFGDIFGIFRLLNDDNDDLPMTQKIDIPETPVYQRHASRLGKLATCTTVPESPDVSDKDDSFFTSPQSDDQQFKRPISFNMSRSSANNSKGHGKKNMFNTSSASSVTDKSQDIYEMDTQIPNSSEHEDIPSSIHTADTQIPVTSDSMSIHSLETQIPSYDRTNTSSKQDEQEDLKYEGDSQENKENFMSIHNANTQIFTNKKIHEAETQLFGETIENVHELDTQCPINDAEKKTELNKTRNTSDESTSKEKVCESDEEILFDVIDGPSFENLDSQQLIPENDPLKCLNENEDGTKERNIDSDCSTDCEDFILPTQKIEINVTKNFKSLAESNLQSNQHQNNSDLIFEDMATQVLDIENPKLAKTGIEDNTSSTQIIRNSNISEDKTNYEDMLTQVICEDIDNPQTEPVILFNGFKTPFLSPVKGEKNNIIKSTSPVKDLMKTDLSKHKAQSSDCDTNYYNATQDILQDLCTQKLSSVKIADNVMADNEFNLIPEKVYSNKLIGSETDDSGVSKLTKKSSSGLSDVESTPTKTRFRILDVDLPDSQEIRSTLTRHVKPNYSDTSSESENEDNSQDNTPIVYKKINRSKSDVKSNLNKLFETNALPSRVITRIRKPTSKLLNCDSKSKHSSEKILKSKLLLEQEDDIDKDIIIENISRLKMTRRGRAKLEASENKSKKNISTKDSESEKKETKLKSSKATTKRKKSESKIEVDIEGGQEICKLKQNSQNDKVDSKKVKTSEVSKKNNQEKLKTEKGGNDKTTVDQNNKKDNSDLSITTSKRSSRRKARSENSKINEKKIAKSTKADNQSKHQTKTEKGGNDEMVAHDYRNIKNDNSDSSITSSKRTTRRKAKSEISGVNEIKSSESSKADNHSKHQTRTNSTSKSVKKRSVTPDNDQDCLRRSKRIKNSVEDWLSNPTESKEQLKKNYSVPSIEVIDKLKFKDRESESKIETSVVYNISSDSTPVNSPKDTKRPSSRSSCPSVKVLQSEQISSSTLRAPSPKIPTQRVLFTAFPNEEVKNKLEQWGAVVVSDVLTCTVIVTLQIKRTFKLLCGVGLGKPIVGPNWVQACADKNGIVDPWNYLILDRAAEQRFKFSLERTLLGKRGFLKGYNLSSTPAVMPSPPELKLIVECSGGKWKEGGAKWICVSTGADKALWPTLKRRGAVLVATEFILAGVLKQELDIEANRLG